MKNVILACALLIGLRANSQKDSSVAKNTIYLEALGNSYFASLNYEHVFKIRKQRLSTSIGLFMYPNRINGKSNNNWDFFYYTIIPVQVNYLFGPNKKWEAGIGITLINGDSNESSGLYYDNVIIDLLAMVKIIGYRFGKKSGGFFGRINLNYTFLLYTEAKGDRSFYGNSFLPGASIGYTFKSRKQ